MSRYIDAEWLKGQINTTFWAEIGKIIDSAPSIDIIRCGECKHNSICNHSVQHTTRDAHTVTIGYKSVEWCSYGEREDK